MARYQGSAAYCVIKGRKERQNWHHLQGTGNWFFAVSRFPTTTDSSKLVNQCRKTRMSSSCPAKVLVKRIAIKEQIKKRKSCHYSRLRKSALELFSTEMGRPESFVANVIDEIAKSTQRVLFQLRKNYVNERCRKRSNTYVLRRWGRLRNSETCFELRILKIVELETFHQTLLQCFASKPCYNASLLQASLDGAWNPLIVPLAMVGPKFYCVQQFMPLTACGTYETVN